MSLLLTGPTRFSIAPSPSALFTPEAAAFPVEGFVVVDRVFVWERSIVWIASSLSSSKVPETETGSVC
jgi:hypothetical protein